MLLRHDGFRRMCRARDLLAEDSERGPSIDVVAGTVGLSRAHFIRQFEVLFGATPHQYRTRRRLERAKLLLASSTQSVTEVCMELGYSSLGSFSGLFTRHMGESPRACQRRLRTLGTAKGVAPSGLTPGCLTLMWSLPSAEGPPSRI